VWDDTVLASLPSDLKSQLTTPVKETVIDIPEIPGIAAPQNGAALWLTFRPNSIRGK
jgi:hypothetical protein